MLKTSQPLQTNLLQHDIMIDFFVSSDRGKQQIGQSPRWLMLATLLWLYIYLLCICIFFFRFNFLALYLLTNYASSSAASHVAKRSSQVFILQCHSSGNAISGEKPAGSFLHLPQLNIASMSSIHKAKDIT